MVREFLEWMLTAIFERNISLCPRITRVALVKIVICIRDWVIEVNHVSLEFKEKGRLAM